MMTIEPGEITKLLHRWRQGDTAAKNQLFELVWPELRRLARCYFRKERNRPLLQPTVIVNEMYLRLHGVEVEWRDRAHFFALAARAMRRYLIDLGRRGEIASVPMDLVPENSTDKRTQLDFALEIDRQLEDLDKHDHDLCVAVELKYFLGLTDEEAADVLRCSRRTFQRRWKDARKWLFAALESQTWKSSRATTST